MKEDHWEDKQSSDSALPLPHRTNPTGGAIRPQMTTGQKQQSPTISFDTGKSKKSQKKEKQKETEFPALFCDNGDCTLGQSHTGVACVWNSCVSTTGEAMAAEMCEGENCHNTTENILCVDDYCHVIEAEFIGFRGVPCAGGVCGYEAGISICNIDKCTFTSEDGLSFGQGEIDINGVPRPCDDQPILCAGLLCACVDPEQHFTTDLLGMEHAGTLNCEHGKCSMHQKQDESSNMQGLPSGLENATDPYGYSPEIFKTD